MLWCLAQLLGQQVTDTADELTKVVPVVLHHTAASPGHHVPQEAKEAGGGKRWRQVTPSVAPIMI